MTKSFTTKHLVLILQCQESFQTPFLGGGWDADLFARVTQCIFGGVKGYFCNVPPREKQSVEVKGKVTSSPKRSGAISLGQDNIDWNLHHNVASRCQTLKPEAGMMDGLD